MSRAQIAASTKTKIGIEYQWAEVGPDKFDCFGLAVWAHGIDIPRTSGDQANGGKAVKIPQAGDLLLFSAELKLNLHRKRVKWSMLQTNQSQSRKLPCQIIGPIAL